MHRELHPWCRLLRWGSSTVADLASYSNARLDQALPGLEIEGEGKKASSQQPQFDSLSDVPLSTQSDTAQISRSPLTHWASANPNALPGGFAEGASTPRLQHNLHNGPDKHSAVERSGSSIPVLLDDSGTATATPVTLLQSDANTTSFSDGQDLPTQLEQAPALDYTMAEQAGDVATSAETPQQSSPQHQHSDVAQQRWRHRRSHWRLVQSQSHVMTDTHGQDAEIQLPQVLRRRSKSRLQVAQGGVVKGIMSLSKHQSGRVSPEKAVGSPSRQESATFLAKAHAHADMSELKLPSIQAAGSRKGLKLRTAAVAAMVPSKSISALHLPLPDKRPLGRRLTMHEVLQSSLQQVQACTAQLEKQCAQQQHLHRALKAMTARTVAMLDHAIYVAVTAQQHHNVQ